MNVFTLGRHRLRPKNQTQDWGDDPPEVRGGYRRWPLCGGNSPEAMRAMRGLDCACGSSGIGMDIGTGEEWLMVGSKVE